MRKREINTCRRFYY